MIKRNTVMEALQRLPAGAHVVWLDQVLPMFRKDMFAIEAVIGMWKSTNHRFRGITVFGRLGSEAEKFSQGALKRAAQSALETA